ncbi:peptidyl-prolyl cis-trans isomerase CYP37, chloroplastic isoform X1 [Arachis stenosperma]|uniref:peptidyl-prolyl cis-trans isomerase CYP37, chloroplastic isoform X1 n=1 Tax=Arachis stenosperma TaxID=217475 RepID=UPI0025ACA126|nr:peptidyl-prolyl cis-trans isomerase CYP37, chloroplastic isoform X1 [Arachis stenosperma]XP_057748805.1 peptidyl-prolyl cis-trans isomerase CYP37, chloroplastic isoform X1 [Arachis stenosperma]
MSLSFSSSSLTVSLTRELSSSSFSPATTTRSFFYRTRPACSPSSTITCFSNSKNHLARAIELAKELVAGQRDTSASVAAEANFVKQLKLKNLVPAIIVSVQITLLLPLVGPWDYSGSYLSPSAMAILYSPDTKVPRTGEVALRRAIPANANMKSIQDSLEDISYLLRIPQRKPYGTMEGNVKKALKIAVDQKESILASIPAELKEKGSLVHASLINGKGGLQALLQSIKEQDADKVSVNLASALDTVAELELLQAPGISFLLPQQYVQYPRLSGRGTVEFTIEKGDGSTFSPVGGESKKTATIQVVIDGYSAPLTAGNFAKLVMDGAYDGAKLSTSNQAILSDNGADKNSGFSVPLEIMPSGQFEPLYKTTLSVQDGELPVLPLSVYGAVAMAHNEVSDEYSSPYQFFFYLYDKRSAGLGGISFDEGQFSVFGYTTNGRDILPQIKTGDIVRSAKLVEGQDRLVLPKDREVCSGSSLPPRS